jgi:hypothetical protein
LVPSLSQALARLCTFWWLLAAAMQFKTRPPSVVPGIEVAAYDDNGNTLFSVQSVRRSEVFFGLMTDDKSALIAGLLIKSETAFVPGFETVTINDAVFVSGESQDQCCV